MAHCVEPKKQQKNEETTIKLQSYYLPLVSMA